VTDTPKLGHYRSDDHAVLKQHIEWAKQADIDFFIVSWLNADGPENANLKKAMLPELERRNTLSFYFTKLVSR